MSNQTLNPEALDKMKVAVAKVISETTYTCSRVWEAWQYGTMSEEDFTPAWEDETLLTEVVEAVLAVAHPEVSTVDELAKAWHAGFCKGEQTAFRERPVNPDTINPYKNGETR